MAGARASPLNFVTNVNVCFNRVRPREMATGLRKALKNRFKVPTVGQRMAVIRTFRQRARRHDLPPPPPLQHAENIRQNWTRHSNNKNYARCCNDHPRALRTLERPENVPASSRTKKKKEAVGLTQFFLRARKTPPLKNHHRTCACMHTRRRFPSVVFLP